MRDYECPNCASIINDENEIVYCPHCQEELCNECIDEHEENCE